MSGDSIDKIGPNKAQTTAEGYTLSLPLSLSLSRWFLFNSLGTTYDLVVGVGLSNCVVLCSINKMLLQNKVTH